MIFHLVLAYLAWGLVCALIILAAAIPLAIYGRIIRPTVRRTVRRLRDYLNL